jgi:hypothetical protein
VAWYEALCLYGTHEPPPDPFKRRDPGEATRSAPVEEEPFYDSDSDDEQEEEATPPIPEESKGVFLTTAVNDWLGSPTAEPARGRRFMVAKASTLAFYGKVARWLVVGVFQNTERGGPLNMQLSKEAWNALGLVKAVLVEYAGTGAKLPSADARQSARAVFHKAHYKLIWALVSVLAESQVVRFEHSPIYQIAAALAIRGAKACHFTSIHLYSPHVAALTFGIRLMWICNRVAAGFPPDDQWQDFFDRFREDRIQYLIAGSTRIMNRLITFLSWLRTTSKQTGGTEQFALDPHDKDLFHFQTTTHISIPKLRIAMKQSIIQAEHLIAHKLFLCLPDDLPEIPIRDIVDDVPSSANGYWFRSEPHNRKIFLERWLLKRVWDDQDLRGRFFHRDSTPNAQEFKKWQKDLAEVLQLLAHCMFVTAGQSPRGPEFLSLQLTNSATSMRSI